MKVQSILISDIIIGERRRDDYGDLQKLVNSINKYRLMEPIVVEEVGDKYLLIAGERRIKAFQMRGDAEIPAHIYTDLTPEDRDAMELEENDERLNLTPLERSKRLLQKVEKTEERISSAMEEKDSRGRKASRKVPKKDIADAIGTGVATIVRAEQHVEAVKSYPELKNEPQKSAIEKAKTLDSLPEKKREQARQNVSQLKPKPSKAPIPRPSKRSVLSTIEEGIYEIERKGGILALSSRMTQQDQFSLLDSINNCIKRLETFSSDLTESLDNSQAEASNF